MGCFNQRNHCDARTRHTREAHLIKLCINTVTHRDGPSRDSRGCKEKRSYPYVWNNWREICQKTEARTWSDLFRLEKSSSQCQNSIGSNSPFCGEEANDCKPDWVCLLCRDKSHLELRKGNCISSEGHHWQLIRAQNTTLQASVNSALPPRALHNAFSELPPSLPILS